MLGREVIGRVRARCAPPRALADLRRRLREQPGTWQVGAEEARLALELRRRREGVARLWDGVQVCASCAVGKAPPHGRFAGGYCCGGATEEIFTDDELGALRLSGTRPRDLRGSATPDAGCLFRGPTGCVLPPTHRADKCLRHICRELAAELHHRRSLGEAEAQCEELHRVHERFVAVRAARLEEELFARSFGPLLRRVRRGAR
jgi:hypothetical protein